MLSALVFIEPFNMAPRGRFQTWQSFSICQEQERKVLKKPSSPLSDVEIIIKMTLWSKGLAGRHIQGEAVWGPNGLWQLRYRSYLPTVVGVASLPSSGLVLLQQPWVMRPPLSQRDEDHILHHCDMFFLCNHLQCRFHFPATHVQISLSLYVSVSLSDTHTAEERAAYLQVTLKDECGIAGILRENSPSPNAWMTFKKNQLPFLCQHGFHTNLAPFAKTF